MNSTPQINLAYLESTFGNNKMVIDKILNSFVSNTPQLMEDLSQHAEKGNREDVKMVAHKMKSSFNTLGATEVGGLLAKIETEAISGNPESLTSMINQVKELNELVFKEIQEELNK